MKYLLYLLITSVVAVLAAIQYRLEPKYTPGMTIEFEVSPVFVHRMRVVEFEIVNTLNIAA